MTCTFDIKIQEKALPGGFMACSDVYGGECVWGSPPVSPEMIIGIIIIIMILAFLAFLVFLVCLLIYCTCKWRRRHGYSSMNVN